MRIDAITGLDFENTMESTFRTVVCKRPRSPASSSVSKPFGERPVVHQRGNNKSKRRCVPGCEVCAGLAVNNGVLQPPDVAGGYRGMAKHCLHGHQPESFPTRRHDHQCASREEFRQTIGINPTPKLESPGRMHLGQPWASSDLR